MKTHISKLSIRFLFLAICIVMAAGCGGGGGSGDSKASNHPTSNETVINGRA
jgi:hypothetical protein